MVYNCIKFFALEDVTDIENQTKACRDMPFRRIGYDSASYCSQIKKEERVVKGKRKKVPVKVRYPVVTIVLYFGENSGITH